VANLLVPDLIAYQGPGTTYSGPTVGPLQNATLTNTGTSSSSPIDVFSVFDSFTIASNGLGGDPGPGADTNPSWSIALAMRASGRSPTSPLTPVGSRSARQTGSSLTKRLRPRARRDDELSPVGLTPWTPAAVAVSPVSTGLVPQQPVRSVAQVAVVPSGCTEPPLRLQGTDRVAV